MKKQTNNILVTFDSGETLESSGSSSAIDETDLDEDLKFITYVLPGYIRDVNKSMSDVKRIEIIINYEH